MSFLKPPKKNISSNVRPTILVELRLADIAGNPIDEQEAWDALVLAFSSHPTYRVEAAKITPDKEKVLK